MVEFACSKHVSAPRALVFDRATDFAGAPARIRSIRRVEMLTPGPVRVGTRFKETRVVFKREATETMEVTEIARPSHVVLGAASCGCRYRFEFRFHDAKEGTEVEMRFAAQPLTWFARVMGLLMRPMVKKVMAECSKDLDDLAASIEAERQGRPAPSPASSA
jgi:hypothetical protein